MIWSKFRKVNINKKQFKNKCNKTVNQFICSIIFTPITDRFSFDILRSGSDKRPNKTDICFPTYDTWSKENANRNA